MFDLDAGEDLEILIETARSFARDELAPVLRRSEEQRSVGPDLRRSFAQIGLARLELPEPLGGAGLGALARALVNEELGAADAGAALALDPLGPALYALAELGGDDAVARFAAPLVERDGARALLVHARDARLEIGASAVSGTIPWVPADRIDVLVILGIEGAVVLERGLELGPLRGAGLRAAGASEVRLAAAPIAARWIGAGEAARALARARLYTAALLLGVLRQACEFSREYALQRVAFGKPIAHHQALAFLIADMRSAVDGARLLLHEAAWHAERGPAFEPLAAGAYVEVVEASRFIGPNGVQILGGHGFMQDYPVEKYMREARVLGLGLGGIDAAREDAARSLCIESGPVSLSSSEGRAWSS
jgi:alkylation response protein AidB-like acyl-CoA dehydrogenase